MHPEQYEDLAAKATNGNDGIDTTSEHQASKHHPLYHTAGTRKDEASLYCKGCIALKEQSGHGAVSYALKSNQAVIEEYGRIASYLARAEPLRCINPDCASNQSDGVQKLSRYGKTLSGSQRYRCQYCGKVITDSDRRRKQRRSEINIRFFDMLVCKAPIRKLASHFGISTRTVYLKIDFIHQQCMSFIANREQKLLEGKLVLDRLYLATDRQVQASNWTHRQDKRNTEIYGIGTACLDTGYIFAFNFNFDNSITQQQVEQEALESGDLNVPKHHRIFARVWLKQEFEESARQGRRKSAINTDMPDDITSEEFDVSTKLPAKGVLIHNEYTMLGHFLHLKNLLQHTGKIRFYMDNDSGMRNAYVSIFKDFIQDDRSDGFLVTGVKNTTVDEKRRAVRETNKLIKEITGVERKLLSGHEFKQVVTRLIEQKLDTLHLRDSSTELWLDYPIATMSEPEKYVAAITNISRFDSTHQANLYRKASLHAIDRFFMMLRRDMLMMERGFSSGTNKSRIWNGYSAYDPAMLTKLGDIFRVYFNFVKTNDKRETPAMRLGLAKGPVSLEKILYFNKHD